MFQTRNSVALSVPKLVRNAPVLTVRSLCNCSQDNPMNPADTNAAKNSIGKQIFLIMIPRLRLM